jgi:precorrin-6B methylase 2
MTSERGGLPTNERLVRANELDMQTDSAGQVRIRRGGRLVTVGSHGLTVLAAFDRPRTVREVVDLLAVGGARDFVDLTATIASLRDAGVLVGEGDGRFAAEPRGWDAPPIHVQMLHDVARTNGFIRAIGALVRPDDVVLDIGTGTGVLAAAAARAGAKKVYAVEASKIADLARAAFERSGLGERIEIVRGWSTQITLPERATLLVTETVGAEPLSERIIDTVHDAWARHLAPGARVVPSRVRVLGTLASMPPGLRDGHLFTARNVEAFQARYGLDFDPFRAAQDASTVRMMLNRDEARSLAPLSEPFVLADVDLTKRPELVFRNEVEVTATRAGNVEAVIVHFELDLSPGNVLDGHPGHVDEAHSWDFVTWLPAGAPPVSPGGRVLVIYDHAAGDARVSLG